MSLRPDIAKPISAQTIDEARAASALIAGAGEMATRLGADPSFAVAVAEAAREQAHTFAKDLVLEIRAAEGDERAAARRMLEQTLTFVEPLLARDEIGLLRDRAAAAAVAV